MQSRRGRYMKTPLSGFDYEVERLDDLTKVPSHWVAEHNARYDFARAFCNMKRVLDAGCGIGYGCKRLAESAKMIHGVDIDVRSIQKARKEYWQNNIYYHVMDLNNLALKDNFFDVVLSFEVIEHIKNYEVYLHEIKKILVEDGIFILSTPNASFSQDRFNPYHFDEFSLEKFGSILRSHFNDVEMYGQSVNLKAASIYQSSLGIFMNKVKKMFGIQFVFTKKTKRLIERLLTGKSLDDARPKDFSISQEKIEKCPVFVGVCKFKMNHAGVQ